MIVAIVSVGVADDVTLPWYFSFMDRRSLSPVGTGGGCGMVTIQEL